MSNLAIGFDIGGTNISVLRIVDSKIEGFQKCPTPENLNSLVETIRDLVLEQAHTQNPSELTVGIGCAGSIEGPINERVNERANEPVNEPVNERANNPVNHLVKDMGKVLVSPNILYLNGVHLKEILFDTISRELKKKLPNTTFRNLRIENDVYAATTGELIFGDGKMEDFIFLAFGTGIGAGRVIAGKQYGGANNFWGEVGHIFITEQDLGVCGCGQKGCWEQIASGKGLARIIQRAMESTDDKFPNLKSLKNENISGHDFAQIFSESAKNIKNAKNIEPNFELKNECMEIIKELAIWMARGIKNVINVCDPGCIILSGGLMNLGDELFQELKNEMKKQAGHNCELKLATHTEWGAAMGAAHLGKG